MFSLIVTKQQQLLLVVFISLNNDKHIQQIFIYF